MSETCFDTIIIGGGMVGLALAKGLINQGLKVAVVEANSPELSWQKNSFSRVSAINRASEILLSKLGVWNDIYKNSVAYHHMFVWDELGGGTIQMDATDIAQTELGFIIENRVIVKSLWESLIQSEAELMHGDAITTISGESGSWVLQLKSGKKLHAKLLVGADGSNSWLRTQFKIGIDQKDYLHTAIVATIKTEKNHQATAWQRFLKTGPLALLPLEDRYKCSIVYSADSEEANRLMSLNEDNFNSEITHNFENKLGGCKLQSRRISFPLVERHIKSYAISGVVFVGDAAHTIHPLAGQGVNLGFQDVKSLIKIISHAYHKGRSISHISTLNEYQRERKWQNQNMILVMRGIKQLFANSNPTVVSLRSLGIAFVNKAKPIKKILIKQAMGI